MFQDFDEGTQANSEPLKDPALSPKPSSGANFSRYSEQNQNIGMSGGTNEQ